MKNTKILSVDAETNGLWGQSFSIGAILMDKVTGTIEEQFIARCPICGCVNDWVRDNVLPAMEGIVDTHEDYPSMLKDFIVWYMERKDNADVIVHMGLPVEAKLFLDAHEFGFIKDFDGPYPLVDISAFPEINVSVDAYNEKHGIPIPELIGGTHNPLYDSITAAMAYNDIVNKY